MKFDKLNIFQEKDLTDEAKYVIVSLPRYGSFFLHRFFGADIWPYGTAEAVCFRTFGRFCRYRGRIKFFRKSGGAINES